MAKIPTAKQIVATFPEARKLHSRGQLLNKNVNSVLLDNGFQVVSFGTFKDAQHPVKPAPTKPRKVENNQQSTKPKPKPKKPSGKKDKGCSGNGGARKGSGRKVGAATKKTREIADKLAESGELTPLEYMLETLRQTPEKLRAQFKSGEITEIEFAIAIKKLDDSRYQAARDAAPYIHPRLSSVEAKVKSTGHEEWLEEILSTKVK